MAKKPEIMVYFVLPCIVPLSDGMALKMAWPFLQIPLDQGEERSRQTAKTGAGPPACHGTVMHVHAVDATYANYNYNLNYNYKHNHNYNHCCIFFPLFPRFDPVLWKTLWITCG